MARRGECKINKKRTENRNIIKGNVKMDIKERFKEAKFIKNKIERLEEAKNYTDYLGGERQEYINQQIEEWKRKLYDYITDTLKDLDKLTNEAQYNIMFRRYIQFKPWEEIAEEYMYTMKWTLVLHRKALYKIEESTL